MLCKNVKMMSLGTPGMYPSGAPAPPPPGAVDPGTIGQAAPYIIPKKVPKPGQTYVKAPLNKLINN